MRDMGPRWTACRKPGHALDGEAARVMTTARIGRPGRFIARPATPELNPCPSGSMRRPPTFPARFDALLAQKREVSEDVDSAARKIIGTWSPVATRR